MGSFSAQLTTAAGSTTLPACALVGSASAKLIIREVQVYNTTATAVSLVFARLTTAGTPGASATSRLMDGSDAQAAIGILKNTYTSTAPTSTEAGWAFVLGAAIGSGVIHTFDVGEFVVPAVANAAMGLLVLSGTGQAVTTTWKWRES